MTPSVDFSKALDDLIELYCQQEFDGKMVVRNIVTPGFVAQLTQLHEAEIRAELNWLVENAEVNRYDYDSMIGDRLARLTPPKQLQPKEEKL